MNPRTSLFFVLTAFSAMLANPLAAAPKTNPALVHPVGEVERHGNVVVVRGTAMIDVMLSLGAPRQKLDADTWLYSGFNGGLAQPRTDDCSTLVVAFKEGRVSDITLVNERAVKLIAANLKPKIDTGARLATTP